MSLQMVPSQEDPLTHLAGKHAVSVWRSGARGREIRSVKGGSGTSALAAACDPDAAQQRKHKEARLPRNTAPYYRGTEVRCFLTRNIGDIRGRPVRQGCTM